MPTPDESSLNPITDIIQTPEQKEARLKAEEELRELLSKLPRKTATY